MDRCTIENVYLKQNKFYGQLVGVWPNQRKSTKYIARLIVSLAISITNVAQLAQVIVFYSLDVLTDQLPFLVLGFTILLKQHSYILKEETLSELLNGMVNDFLSDRPKEEIAILDTYAKRAMLFSFCYKVSICFSMITFLSIPAVPPIMDIFAPLNESRERTFTYPSYYFVDNQEYYFPILGHEIFSGLILGGVFIACDVTLIHVVQHACGLLAVSGYRFEHVMDDVDFYQEKYSDSLISKSYSPLKKNHALLDKSYARVIQSIIAHKRAMEYVELIEECHVGYFFFVIGMIIVEFAITFYKLATLDMGMLYFTFCAFTAAQLSHLFFITVMGQFVIDSNEEIFQKITEAEWYNGSVRTQSLFVLVLRRCLSPPTLTGGGFVTLNLDSFVQILKLSFSYFTVMRSS